LCDDYNGKKNSFSQDQRQKVIDHYQYNQAILDPDGIMTIIGTRWHDLDLIGWILGHEIGLENFRDRSNLKGLFEDERVFYA
jgi:hypothetical protein